MFKCPHDGDSTEGARVVGVAGARSFNSLSIESIRERLGGGSDGGDGDGDGGDGDGGGSDGGDDEEGGGGGGGRGDRSWVALGRE